MLITLFVSAFSYIINVPLGIWREHYKRFSLPWFIIIHLSVPVIIVLRIYLNANPYFIPLFIALAIAGQTTGKKIAVTYRKKHQ